MPKRKREDGEASDNEQPSRHTGPQRKRAEEKLFHAQKIVQRALKIAKGFERQKLGRRQKTATKEKDEATLKRLEAEIEALKNLDLSAAGETHLHKVLLKDKAISQSPALPEKVITNSKVNLDIATANVTARLYNSNAVKEAVAEALPNIRLALGLPPPARQSKKGAGSAEPDKRKKATQENTRSVQAVEATEDISDDDELESEDEEDNINKGKSSTRTGKMAVMDDDDDDDDFAALDSRLADPSDDESSFGSEEESLGAGPVGRTKASFKSSIDMSLSPSPSPSLSRSVSPVSKTKAIKKKPTASGGPAASKVFLPSLTMGGYYSDSNSEAENLSDADVAPRKNRRGQRARQLIWEKKFGQKAKHIQDGSKPQTKKAGGGRDDGWDLKRGAQQEGAAKGGKYQPAWKKAKGHEKRGGTDGHASGGNAIQVAPRQRKVETSNKPLHPSWEAAKRAKEKKAETVAFTGKKVVFD